MKELGNKNFVQKSNDTKKREYALSRCLKLLSENEFLISKINELELIIQKFSTG